jgi:transcriptional regulator with GAF, ATPase, and Fis domain
VITSRLGALHFDIAQDSEHAIEPDETAESEVSPHGTAILTDDEMKRRERENVAAALRQSRGRVYGSGGAAELLEMKPATLNARIKKFGLSKSV